MLSICIGSTTTRWSHFNIFLVEFQLIRWPNWLSYYVASQDLGLLQTTIFFWILISLAQRYVYLMRKWSCEGTYWSVSRRLNLDAIYCWIVTYWLSWIKVFGNIFVLQQNVIWWSQSCNSLVIIWTLLKI
jgi:hypothetical protein